MKRFAAASFFIACSVAMITEGRSQSFGGYDCVDDCSGHAAGYRWAEENYIEHADECPLPNNSYSFYEGCLVYTEDPYRGGDEDDDGNWVD